MFFLYNCNNLVFDETRKILKLKNEKLKETDIIELNIGGTIEIITTKGTLLKYLNSILSLYFNRIIKLPKKMENIL